MSYMKITYSDGTFDEDGTADSTNTDSATYPSTNLGMVGIKVALGSDE